MTRRRWIFLTVGLVLLLAAVATAATIYLYREARVIPEYYVEVLEVPSEQARESSEQMLQKTTELVNVAQRAGQWQAVFTQDEINGWLAVDLVENHGDAMPSELRDPRLILEDNHAILACYMDIGHFAGVLSIVVDVFVAENNRLALRLKSLKAGRLSLPKSWLLDELAREAKNASLPIEWQQRDGDPVLLIELDPRTEKGEPIELEAIRIADGRVQLAGKTERNR